MKIAFAHNVFNRSKTLKETIDKELLFFPNSQLCIAYNGEIDFKLLNTINNAAFVPYTPRSHKAGCANGFIVSLRLLSNSDADVVFFSHDDISINKNFFNVFQQNLDYIASGEFDIVLRKPKNIPNQLMMEGIFFKREVLKKIFNDSVKIFKTDEEIPVDHRGSHSPEIFLNNIIFNNTSIDKTRIKVIEYIHSDKDYDDVLSKTLGLVHKRSGVRGWTD